MSEHGKRRAARAREMREIFAGRAPRIFAARFGAFQIVFGKGRRIFGQDAPYAFPVNLLEGSEMREHFGDGPAVGLGLPVEKPARQIGKQRFEKLRRLC